MAFADELLSLVSKSQKTVITSHLSPDDDSISSVLSTYQILKRKFPSQNISVIYTGTSDNRWVSFSGYSETNFVDDLANHLDAADCLIMLDGSEYQRFTYQPDSIKAFPGKTICIDHHSSPPNEFTLQYIDKEATSTAELIFRIFSQSISIDAVISETLLLGILGDTGNFSYIKPSQIGIFDIVKKLVQVSGIEIQDFKSKYDTISPKVFLGIRELITNHKYHQVSNWPDFTSATISREFAQKNQLNDNELSAASHAYLSNYCRLITGYKWGVSLVPRMNGSVNISLRSLPGSVNVRAIVEQMGIGGGHDRAAGGGFKPTPGSQVDTPESLEKFLTWVRNNRPA